MSATRTKNALIKELNKWQAQSQKLKTSAHISYGKIRSFLAVLETTMSKEEANKLANHIGDFN